MEAILFVGIQASGKSTLYKENYFNTHVRISNDLLKTKHREKMLLRCCFETGMPLVIDNTNVTKAARAKYIELLRQHKYAIKCYYFRADVSRSLAWNSTRKGKELIPAVGILGTYKRLEIPERLEGFDEMYYVDFENGTHIVKAWEDEV